MNFLKNGVVKADRPAKAEYTLEYLTKIEWALNLLKEFIKNYCDIKITILMTEALYETRYFSW